MTREVAGVPGLAGQVLAAPAAGRRRLVALAGAPGSGKSALAARLAAQLAAMGHAAQVVPMDGFHLDNRLLRTRGLLPRKGAPETFDLGGLSRLAAALREEAEVFYPLFDRARDIAIAGAGQADPGCATVILEGNYLLFDAPGWRGLAAHWDISVRLRVPREVLRDRLVQRWLAHGLAPAAARARAEENDLNNADRIAAAELPADLLWTGELP